MPSDGRGRCVADAGIPPSPAALRRRSSSPFLAPAPTAVGAAEDRVAKAYGGGISGYLKSAKDALFEAITESGSCDGLLVLAPEGEEHLVQVDGASGAAAGANGLYEPTRERIA